MEFNELRELQELVKVDNPALFEQIDEVLKKEDPEACEYAVMMIKSYHAVASSVHPDGTRDWSKLDPYSIHKAYGDALDADVAKNKA